jgi:hypothetical protein
MPEPVAIDDRTHILIGVRANGVMTVIADWPHVPRCRRKSTRPATGTRRSRCVPRPRSSRPPTGVREEGGIGRLRRAAGEAARDLRRRKGDVRIVVAEIRLKLQRQLRLQSNAVAMPSSPYRFWRHKFPHFIEEIFLARPGPLSAAYAGLLLGLVPSGKKLLRRLLRASLHRAHARNVHGVLVPVSKRAAPSPPGIGASGWGARGYARRSDCGSSSRYWARYRTHRPLPRSSRPDRLHRHRHRPPSLWRDPPTAMP